MKRVKLFAVSALLLASAAFTNTADAHWIFAQGNNAVIEMPTTSSYWYKGWGFDAVVGSGKTDWIHIPIPFGDTLRANTIFLRFLTGTPAGNDVKISCIGVYNGDVAVKDFGCSLNYTSTPSGSFRELSLNLGSTYYFSRGLSISLGVTGGTSATAVYRRFVLATAGAQLVQ